MLRNSSSWCGWRLLYPWLSIHGCSIISSVYCIVNRNRGEIFKQTSLAIDRFWGTVHFVCPKWIPEKTFITRNTLNWVYRKVWVAMLWQLWSFACLRPRWTKTRLSRRWCLGSEWRPSKTTWRPMWNSRQTTGRNSIKTNATRAPRSKNLCSNSSKSAKNIEKVYCADKQSLLSFLFSHQFFVWHF